MNIYADFILFDVTRRERKGQEYRQALKTYQNSGIILLFRAQCKRTTEKTWAIPEFRGRKGEEIQ